MCRFEVQCCSVCYEYLTSGLCVLSRCGHVYHRDCLAQWTSRTAKNHAGCPLCRCDIPRGTIIELKFECIERRSPRNSQDGETERSDASAQSISQKELEDVKRRLSQAVADKMDMQEQCTSLENENISLQKTVLYMQDAHDELDKENKDLKLSAAANKTRISKLNDLVERQKEQLSKLEATSQYLASDKNNLEGSNLFLKSLSTSEQLSLLTNRVSELESMNKTLSDLRDGWKKRCDKVSRDFLALEREHSTLLMTLQSNALSQLPPDPLSEEPLPKMRHLEAEKVSDEPRKISRSIDFGFMRNSNIALKNPQKDVRPSPFGISTAGIERKSLKARPQNIVKFFKAQ